MMRWLLRIVIIYPNVSCAKGRGYIQYMHMLVINDYGVRRIACNMYLGLMAEIQKLSQ